MRKLDKNNTGKHMRGLALAAVALIAGVTALSPVCVATGMASGITVLVGEDDFSPDGGVNELFPMGPLSGGTALPGQAAGSADSSLSAAESMPETADSGVEEVASVPEEMEGAASSAAESMAEGAHPSARSAAEGAHSSVESVAEPMDDGTTSAFEEAESAAEDAAGTTAGTGDADSAGSASETAVDSAVESAAESVAESMASGAEDVAPAGGSTRVRLGFAGDINFDENWSTTKFMDSVGGITDVISPNLIELLNGFDIFMINNEFTYSTRGEEVQKSYHFRADPSRVSNLDVLGTDIVLLANNHVFDYGEDALADTLDTLAEAGIPYVGAGRDIDEAASPYVFEVGGRTLAYVAASRAEEYTPSIATREAGEGVSGIMPFYDPEPFLEAIRKADESYDFVVANVHWGMEYDSYYYDIQQELARKMVEAGADLIIGTHTHCLQGVDIIDGVPVFYSLGNFWFNDKDLMNGVAEITLDLPEDRKKPVSIEEVRFHPCTQYGMRTDMPDDPDDRAWIISHLSEISKGLVNIDGEGVITKADA